MLPLKTDLSLVEQFILRKIITQDKKQPLIQVLQPITKTTILTLIRRD